MPLDEKISEGLKGNNSNIVNSSRQRWGGAIEAAEFLRYFVDKDVSWTHLDIAGVGMETNGGGKAGAKHASGFGVATILKYFLS